MKGVGGGGAGVSGVKAGAHASAANENGEF